MVVETGAVLEMAPLSRRSPSKFKREEREKRERKREDSERKSTSIYIYIIYMAKNNGKKKKINKKYLGQIKT